MVECLSIYQDYHNAFQTACICVAFLYVCSCILYMRVSMWTCMCVAFCHITLCCRIISECWWQSLFFIWMDERGWVMMVSICRFPPEPQMEQHQLFIIISNPPIARTKYRLYTPSLASISFVHYCHFPDPACSTISTPFSSQELLEGAWCITGFMINHKTASPCLGESL